MSKKPAKKSYFPNGKRRLLSAAVMGALIGSSITSTAGFGAGLSESLNSMLVATGGPQIAQSQQGMVLQGGYAAVRIPNQSYNVVSFAPPNLSMGCGGINLFLGSFSFINAAQFVAMLKQIGEGLAVVAFQTALSTMCAHCMDILNYLQQAMQDMNNAMRGYCEAGSGFSIANFSQSMEKAGAAFGNLFDAATGNGSGFTSAVAGESTAPGQTFQNLFANEQSAIETYVGLPQKTCTYNSSGVETCSTAPAVSSTVNTTPSDASLVPDMGNFTWRNLQSSQSQEILSGVAPNDELAMEMVMSIAGTTVSLPPAENSAGQQSAKGKAVKYLPKLSIKGLKHGVTGAQMWVCEAKVVTMNGSPVTLPQYGLNTSTNTNNSLACSAMETTSLKQAGFVPIDAYVKMMMTGPSPTATSAYQQTYHQGLLTYVTDASKTTLSAAQQNFVAEMPWPVLGYMQTAEDTDGTNGESTATLLATEFEKPLEAEIDYKYLLAIQSVLDNAQSDQGNFPMSSTTMLAVMKNLRADINADQVEIQIGWQFDREAIKLINERAPKTSYNNKASN